MYDVRLWANQQRLARRSSNSRCCQMDYHIYLTALRPDAIPMGLFTQKEM